MTHLSPKAEKARSDAEARRFLAYLDSTPHLLRTGQAAVIRPPSWRTNRREFARQMPELLPDFKWNGKRDWYEGPLASIPAAYAALCELTGSRIPTSPGVDEWLAEEAQAAEGGET